jgi:hypothetical protein
MRRGRRKRIKGKISHERMQTTEVHVYPRVNRRIHAFMMYQQSDKAPDLKQAHKEFASFMVLFGGRLATSYSLICASCCAVLMALSYYLSPTGATVSMVSISWIAIFYGVGITNLAKHLFREVQHNHCCRCSHKDRGSLVWQVDMGKGDEGNPIRAPPPPLECTMAVVFIACANMSLMFTIAVDRCDEIGGSATRGRVLFASLLIDYLCLFSYTCYKWWFVVKKPGLTDTIEFDMPREAVGNVDSDKSKAPGVGSEPNEGIASVLARDSSESRATQVKKQIDLRMPKHPGALKPYWVLKKHGTEILDDEDIETEEGGLFAFNKDGKALVRFDVTYDGLEGPAPEQYNAGTFHGPDKNKKGVLVERSHSDVALAGWGLKDIKSKGATRPNPKKWIASRVMEEDGGLLAQFQSEIDATKTKREVAPLKWKDYFYPAANGAQLISFCFFWANITAISFIPEIKWGFPGIYLGNVWRVLGEILKLTLFDVTWPDLNLPYLNVEVSALDFYVTQFAIALLCAVIFPFAALAYKQYFAQFADVQKSLDTKYREQTQKLTQLQREQAILEKIVWDKEVAETEKRDASKELSTAVEKSNKAVLEKERLENVESVQKEDLKKKKDKLTQTKKAITDLETERRRHESSADETLVRELQALNRSIAVDAAERVRGRDDAEKKHDSAWGDLVKGQVKLETRVKEWVANRIQVAQSAEDEAKTLVDALETERQKKQDDQSNLEQQLQELDAEIATNTEEVTAEEAQMQTQHIEFEFSVKDAGKGWGCAKAGFTLPQTGSKCDVQSVSGPAAAVKSTDGKFTGMAVGDVVVGLTVPFRGVGGMVSWVSERKQKFEKAQFKFGPPDVQGVWLENLMKQEGYSLREDGQYENKVLCSCNIAHI